jgi:hypothetical protein
MQNSGARRRENMDSRDRHCEEQRDETIHVAYVALTCFAKLAMTECAI